jgi:hypothetical protein
MVPASFGNYFMAMAGAGGALIGLLFVAISINPGRTFGHSAIAERQAVAASTFTALANAFFISAAGLLPGHDVLGPTALALACAALLNTIWLAVRLVPQVYRRSHASRRWRAFIALLIMLAAGVFVYGEELLNAVSLLRKPSDPEPIFVLATLLLVVYGIALIRAWELLGAPRSGISGWLNPLAELDADAPSAAPVEDGTPAKEAAPANDAAPRRQG